MNDHIFGLHSKCFVDVFDQKLFKTEVLKEATGLK